MSDYTFKQECSSCEQKPIIKQTGMCSTCTFGERSSMWEWLDTKLSFEERKLAVDCTMAMFNEVDLIEDDNSVNPIKAALLHIDQSVVDKVEKLIDSVEK